MTGTASFKPDALFRHGFFIKLFPTYILTCCHDENCINTSFLPPVEYDLWSEGGFYRNFQTID